MPQQLLHSANVVARLEHVRGKAVAQHVGSAGLVDSGAPRRFKTPLAGPAAVLQYLSRYTHRTAIGHERLLGIEGDKVRIRVRADDTGGKRTIALDGVQFIGRLLQHVLPPGFKRVRHYGLLAPAAKAQRLTLARSLLHMPASNPVAREEAQAFMRRVAAIEIECCAHCKTGRWRVVENLPVDRTALACIARTVPRPACRSPP